MKKHLFSNSEFCRDMFHMSMEELAADQESYEVVPEKVTVGFFDNGDYNEGTSSGGWRCGYVSCRHKGRWIGESIFKRLVGFKPGKQRDDEQELNKAIMHATEEIDNVPLEGFRVVSLHEDVYGTTSSYGDIDDVVLEDPRGFKVGVKFENFCWLLRRNGFNVKDGVLAGKFVYAFADSFSHVLLADAKSEKCKQLMAEAKKPKDKEAEAKFVKPSQLIAGKVYMHAELKVPMTYVGRMDTYSTQCQKAAFINGSYSDVLGKFLEQRTDTTRRDQFVFYRHTMKHIKNSSGNHGYADSYGHVDCYFYGDSFATAPYYVVGSVSKKFVDRTAEDGAVDLGVMYNDRSKAATYENILEDVKCCVLFNKLDLKRPRSEVQLTEEEFEDLIQLQKSTELDASKWEIDFPFSRSDLATWIHSRMLDRWVRVRSQTDDVLEVDREDLEVSYDWSYRYWRDSGNSQSFLYRTYGAIPEFSFDRSGIKKMHQMLEPMCEEVWLENGQKLATKEACCFAREEKYNKWF